MGLGKDLRLLSSSLLYVSRWQAEGERRFRRENFHARLDFAVERLNEAE